MSLVSQLSSSIDFNNEEEVDNFSIAQYLLTQTNKIGDTYTFEQSHESDKIITIYFDKFPILIQPYMKAYMLHQRELISNKASTISSSISIFANFIEYAKVQNFDTTDLKKEFQSYRVHLGQRVKDLKSQENLSPRTAMGYSIEIIKFLNFMTLFDEKYNWIVLEKALPQTIVDYLSVAEKMELQKELEDMEFQKKYPLLSYEALIEIMEFLYKQPPSYAKTAFIIAAHTGLRISEIRHLKIDCLVSVSGEEKKFAEKYAKEIGKSPVLDLDFSKSYWLNYEVIKGKDEPTQGMPILVSNNVKVAVDELLEMTQDLRESHLGEFLFVNYIGNSNSLEQVSIRSYTAFMTDRDKFVAEGMPFFTPHQMRVMFATILADLGVSEEIIAKYLNHVSTDVTALYYRSDMERQHKVIQSLIRDETTHRTQEVQEFITEVRGVVETELYEQLTFHSKINLFKLLQKQHNIKLNFSEHGLCVLPINEYCPYGYDGVKVCASSGCLKFEPELNERPFFVNLLQQREQFKERYAELANEHNIEVDIEQFEQEINNITDTIKMIDEAKERIDNA